MSLKTYSIDYLGIIEVSAFFLVNCLFLFVCLCFVFSYRNFEFVFFFLLVLFILYVFGLKTISLNLAKYLFDHKSNIMYIGLFLSSKKKQTTIKIKYSTKIEHKNLALHVTSTNKTTTYKTFKKTKKDDVAVIYTL
ncbi:hypothetical protein RFI_12452 [Reticulomyxa filosa]|uniref:Uncharacterized protein n=1 Tax=Reticulomyxa filosa TaxID=46433 RepID=X6NFE5_RETFI|nr:hypothetical protein RFI_12452 [Reticulomyxa filosa]|eukprot:ETO24706.1 hypothetical protein RFI_12452 [Reticulomyxa filosa]